MKLSEFTPFLLFYGVFLTEYYTRVILWCIVSLSKYPRPFLIKKKNSFPTNTLFPSLESHFYPIFTSFPCCEYVFSTHCSYVVHRGAGCGHGAWCPCGAQGEERAGKGWSSWLSSIRILACQQVCLDLICSWRTSILLNQYNIYLMRAQR